MSDTKCADFLLERFRETPDQTAFIHEDQSYTYAWVLSRIGEYENFLSEKGIGRGDIVIAVADYSPEFFCFMLAGMRQGILLGPLTNESIVEREVVFEISECQFFVLFAKEISAIEVTRRDAEVRNSLTLALIASGEPGLILFSSGSTGKPKGILHSFARVLEKFRTKRDRIVAITFLMLDHFGGINTLLHILSNLGTVVTVKTRTVDAICEAIEKYKVEVLPTTPSFLNILARTEAHRKYDLSSLKVISYGTEVMPEPTLERLKKLFPNVKLQQTYGLSELGVLRSKSRDDGSLWVKIGGGGFQTKVVDGILWIKSEYAMLGYLNAPHPFDAEGWFNTQDRVEVDGDCFRILGRATDLINIGGQKVYPSEVEDVIIELDNIEDVSVVGEKGGLLNQMVVAHVVTRTPEDVDSLKKRIRKACAAVLSPYKVPTKVVIATGALYSSRHKKLRSAAALSGSSDASV